MDPGSLKTGFAIFEHLSQRPKLLSSGTIFLKENLPLGQRLFELAEDFDQILKKFKPEAMAIESLFFARNAKSALHLGHARGVLLMKASSYKMKIFEYTPTEVKKSVSGSGRAPKDGLEKMIRLLLGLSSNFKVASSDEADAIAIGLTHSQGFKWKGKNDRASFWQNHI